MKNKVPVKRLLLLLLALVMAACVVMPIPYYVEAPGATIQLSELIKVNDQTDKREGSFSLTAVGIRQASVVLAVKAWFDPFEEVISKDQLMGQATDAEYDRIQNFYMETSQNNAIEEALKLAKKPYEMKYMGVYVLGVEKTSAFSGLISVGDTVTKIDGQDFKASSELMDYVQGKKVGDEVKVTYIQDGKTKEATGKLMKLPSNGKAGIGITLTDHTEIDSSEKIKFNTEDIGGPSAGLMFTLEIYQQLIDTDLRKGRDIAGTGTIDTEGNVGQIGGIDKKVASASESGATVFFAPKDKEKGDSNYKDAKAAAKKLKTDMKIVPVGTLQEAVDYLQK